MHLYDVIRHALAHGCELHEERGNHALYRNPATGAVTPFPRHITDGPARVERICAELGIPLPEEHDAPTPPENWCGLMVEIPPPYRYPDGSSWGK